MAESESHVAEMERVLEKFADTFQTDIGNITAADLTPTCAAWMLRQRAATSIGAKS